jgi:hypothetical protein
MPAERREQVIAIGLGSTGNGRSPMFNGRRQPSCGGTSRISREAYVRFCEGLGVKFPGPTRQLLTPCSAPACLLPPNADIAMFCRPRRPKRRASATGPNVPAASAPQPAAVRPAAEASASCRDRREAKVGCKRDIAASISPVSRTAAALSSTARASNANRF